MSKIIDLPEVDIQPADGFDIFTREFKVRAHEVF